MFLKLVTTTTEYTNLKEDYLQRTPGMSLDPNLIQHFFNGIGTKKRHPNEIC